MDVGFVSFLLSLSREFMRLSKRISNPEFSEDGEMYIYEKELGIMYLYNKLKCCPAYTALSCFYSTLHTEAEFLDEIQTKFLRVFLLAIYSHLYRFALRFLFL
jgi:hypothetical protein